MVKITVSDELHERLGQTEDVAELCDRSGRTLGHFVPVAGIGREGTPDECPYTEEELARMRSETGGRALAEIWEHLGRRS
jgi:hypothetical protein